MSFHPVLQRQLEKYFGAGFIPEAGMAKFFEAVSLAYSGYDENLKLSERSLEIASKELGELNQKQRGDILALQDTKSAMMNLLEDSRTLESSLEIERDLSQGIISSMGEGLLAVDKNYNLTIINPVAEKLLDIKAKDYIGKPWTQIATTLKGDKDVPENERTFLKALQTGQIIVTSVSDNHYYRTVSGKVFPVASITAPLKNENGIIGAVKVFRDATYEKEEKQRIEKIVEERTAQLTEKNVALKNAQAQISQGWIQVQEEKARLNASINALPLGFFIVNPKHQIITMNARMRDILGLTHEVSSFEEVEESFKGTTFELKNVCNHCRNDRKPYENKDIEFRGKFLRGFSVPVISNNELLGTAVLIEDITEARVLERSKDEFFSIASHELRTPLTAIRGNTSMIMDYFMADLKDENVKSMIRDIHESSLRLIGIVNDFLDLSRLEQKRLEFKKEDVDIVALSKEVMEELKPNAGAAVTLVVTDTPNLPHLLSDKNKVKETIINLVGNALKFTEKGSVTISFEAKDHIVETLITDTGRGISLANQVLLFRKFQQASDSLLTRDTTKGTGLGLYISKLMIEGMGGKIRLVRSVPGVGTTFGFALPAFPRGSTPPVNTNPPTPAAGSVTLQSS